MKTVRFQILPLCLVILIAAIGGWAGASGLFVFSMNRLTSGLGEWRHLTTFHFFPPLSWAPIDTYPILAFSIVVICQAAVWLMRHRTIRPLPPNDRSSPDDTAGRF